MAAVMAMNHKITIRIPDELAGAFERYMADMPEGAVTRQEAIRRILEDWLTREGYRADPSAVDEDLIRPNDLSL